MTERETPLSLAPPIETKPQPGSKGAEVALESDADRRSGEDRRGEEDRRGPTRYFLTADAEVIEPQTRTRSTGRATDISEGGCYLDTLSPLPVGTGVYVRLSRGGEAFQSKATVTYCLTGMGIGLAFKEMAADQSAVLAQWIAELSGQSVLEMTPDSGDLFATEKSPAATTTTAWREVVGELLGLLTKKQVFTESEVAALRKKLSE